MPNTRRRCEASSRCAIELDPRNHALLYLGLPGGANPIDLGEVPATVTQAAQLSSHLERLVSALPDLNKMFANPQGQRYSILTFAIIYNDHQIAEFGIRAP